MAAVRALLGERSILHRARCDWLAEGHEREPVAVAQRADELLPARAGVVNLVVVVHAEPLISSTSVTLGRFLDLLELREHGVEHVHGRHGQGGFGLGRVHPVRRVDGRAHRHVHRGRAGSRAATPFAAGPGRADNRCSCARGLAAFGRDPIRARRSPPDDRSRTCLPSGRWPPSAALVGGWSPGIAFDDHVLVEHGGVEVARAVGDDLSCRKIPSNCRNARRPASMPETNRTVAGVAHVVER